MDVLRILISNAELFIKLSPLNCSIVITDTEGIVLKSINPTGDDNLTVNEGIKMSSEGGLTECLRTGKEVKKNIPKEVYGTLIRVIAVPVYYDNKIIGAISTCTDLTAQETLKNVASDITSTSEEITATTEEVAASSISLAANLESLKDKILDVTNELNMTDDILRLINQISKNSKLLGINAAIESARAGEHGKGFAVVSKEIQKMAKVSMNSLKDIENALNRIEEKASTMLRAINEISSLGEQQSTATKEVALAIQKLASSAMNLEEISKII